MKLGAERKKVAILAVLLLIAGYFLFTNLFSGSTPQSAPPAARAGTEMPPEIGRPVPRSEVRKTAPSRLQEFRPSLKPRKPGETVDLSSIDATLRLDLLAKLHDVKALGGERSLFDFGSVPAAKPEPKVIPKPIYTVAPAPSPVVPPPPPPPPRIALKFYGYTMPAPQGAKRAFFVDGEEILIGAEGDVLKKRYRVVKIGVNSVVMEDLETKSEQTLPLEPQVAPV
jgi:hypothetical protein